MAFVTSLNSATAILLMMNPPWHSSGPLGRSGRKTSGRISTGYKYRQLREGLLFCKVIHVDFWDVLMYCICNRIKYDT